MSSTSNTFMTLGEKIRYLRKQKLLSQDELAYSANITLNTLEAAETGKRNTSSGTIKKLAKALGVDVSELTSGKNQTEPVRVLAMVELGQRLDEEASDIKNEGATEQVKAIANAIQSGLDGQKIGGDVIAWARSQEVLLSRLDDTLGGKRLYPVAEVNLLLLRQLVEKRAASGQEERDLQLALAHNARLAAWLAQDAGYHKVAEQHYRLGIEAARSIDHPDFAAYCTAMLAFQAVDNGFPMQCLRLLEEAEAEATKDSPLHIAISQWFVQPLGLIGDQKGAASRLIKADALWEERDAERIPEWLYWMLRPSHTSEVPRGFIENDPATAVQLLQSGLDSLDSEFERDRVLFLMGLAEAQKADRKLDEAMSTATEVINILATDNVPRAESRIIDFSRHLPDDPIAAKFRERFESYVHLRNIRKPQS